MLFVDSCSNHRVTYVIFRVT